MATYSRMGSYLLSGELSNDPLGRIHRGIVLVGDKFDRHVLVRTFFDELLQQGIAGKMAEAGKVVPLLGGSKAFGVGYRMEGGTVPHVVCDYVPGRSLAALLVKSKQEQIPFGVDHALSVMQGIAQALVLLHGKDLQHGILSPHSVWLSFEGATHLLDAPFAAQIRALLPKCPVTQTSLEAYLRSTGTPLQQDFYSLGAILYEMLTLDRLPTGGDPGAFVRGATLKAAQEDGPIPAEIQGLLLRLLGVDRPFTSIQDFNGEMERVLYDGDYSPTTFNMAFFMHTLFREENDTDSQAMKAEAADNFSAYQMVAAEAAAGGRRGSEPLVAGESEAQKSKKLLIGVAAAAVVIIAGLSAFAFRKDPEKERLEAQVAELERQKAEFQMQRANLETQGKDVQAKIQEKERAVAEAKTTAEKEKAAKELEEQKKKQADLEKQKQELAAKSKQVEIHSQQAAKGVEPSGLATVPPAAAPATKPAEPKAEPKPAEPKPTPAAPAPTPAAPTPAPPAPTPVAPAPAAAKPSVVVPPQILNQAQPAYPARARQMKQMVRNLNPVVTLKVFVDASGRPQKVQIVEGVEGPYGFNEEAEKAALESKFQPGSKDGKPAPDWVTITYRFPKSVK